MRVLRSSESDGEQDRANVLVRNSKGSTSDQFSVSWENSDLPALPFLVPAGSNKILRVPRGSDALSSNKLILSGDDVDFDNQFFAIPPISQTVSIGYIGDESPDDPEGMLYYFKRALIETPTTTYDLQQFPTATDSAAADFAKLDFGSPEFLVVTRPVSEDEKTSIDQLLKNGVTLLVALSDQSMLDSTGQWTGVTSVEKSNERKKDKEGNYAMLGNIDFSHPVFVPFSGPRFNDFTQIRFWEFLQPTLSDNVQVLARFDDDTPALWHQLSNDKSDIYVLGCGWQPAKSQLALSSKFLPLMMRMIELAIKTEPVAQSSIVGDSIQTPQGYDRLLLPDGTTQPVEASSTQTLNLPGIYSFASSSAARLADLSFAVNLDPAESQIDLMPVDQISALGVTVGSHNSSALEVEKQRQLLDFELENRQKLWKWLILGAIGLIIAESWLAGKTDRMNRSMESTEQGAENE